LKRKEDGKSTSYNILDEDKQILESHLSNLVSTDGVYAAPNCDVVLSWT
jgi:hypothetical protein